MSGGCVGCNGKKNCSSFCTNFLFMVILVILTTRGNQIDGRPNQPNTDGGATKETAKDSTADNLLVSQQEDVQPTPVASKHGGHTNVDPKSKAHEHGDNAWLVYTSAIPTILVFIICVIAIAIRNRFVNDDTIQDVVEGPPTPKKRKSKPKRNQEVYDTMLAKFKDEKNRKRSFVGRKSSQIRIEGMVSRSPKSLARKHIIIGQLNEEDLAPDGNSSALGQLVQLSTHTFIGSSLIENMETPKWQTEASEQARKDLSARIMMEADENDALLPEDLEDVFSNFGNWEESLI